MKGAPLVRQAYNDVGALEVTCPHCGAVAGQWCTKSDGRVRRVPCVQRATAGIGTGDGRPHGHDFGEPRHLAPRKV